MNPEIFLKAAKLYTNKNKSSPPYEMGAYRKFDSGACDAICVALRGHDCRFIYETEYHEFFREYFKPENVSGIASWFGKFGSSQANEVRVTALLFCYEMAKRKRR